MKMRILIIFAITLCISATEVPENKNAETNKEKRQSQEGTLSHLAYRSAKQEQIAPVEEPQEEDKPPIRNGTSLQPDMKDPGANRPTRNMKLKTRDLTTPAPAAQQNTFEITNTIDLTSEVPQPLFVRQVDIEHRGLSLEDRRQSHIPPPKDGRSYTPEEFTSLIIAGYAVTPIPDISFDVAESNSLVGSYSTTASPPTQYTASPAYDTDNLPGISSPTPFALRDEQSKIQQARLELGLAHYRQRLALQQSLPPPRNSKGYSPEEFNSLVAAGYAVTPVPVNQYDDDVGVTKSSRADEYRPGQVFSLNPQELLDLQPERKAPLPSNQLLQQLYGNQQQEHKQNLQQVYYLDPQAQSGRQIPPSHAVIARPHFSFNGGEASVGAALSVSDTGASSSGESSFNQEILALLGQSVRPQESRAQAQQSSAVQSVAPQYQQIDRYITKPSKKPTKLRSKVRTEPQAQPTAAPQQYLIETTNVQQQQQQQQQPQQYRPTQQPPRLAQSLRYVPIQQSPQLDQFLYERPESQGLKIVPAPKLNQQPRAQFNYRLAPQAQQYQQQEVAPAPKQYRLIEVPRAQPIRQELRLPASSVERPVAYLKRFPDIDKQRSVKIYDPVAPETQQSTQLYGEQFVLRPAYRNEQRPRYEIVQPKLEQARADSTKPPHSAIYVSKNLPLRQNVRPQSSLREQSIEQPSIDIVQHGQSLEQQRSQLPPPKNNKAYTPEEFAALVAAGYSVTPVPVSALNLDVAQSRTSIDTEPVHAQPKRRLAQRRRNQYLPVRDDSP